MGDVENKIFNELEEKFPHCLFTQRGKTIILNDGGFHNEIPIFNMTKLKGEYDIGIHKELIEFLNQNGFVAIYKNNKLYISNQEE